MACIWFFFLRSGLLQASEQAAPQDAAANSSKSSSHPADLRLACTSTANDPLVEFQASQETQPHAQAEADLDIASQLGRRLSSTNSHAMSINTICSQGMHD